MARATAVRPSGASHGLHVAVAAAAAFSWLALWLGDRLPYGRYLDHESATAGAPLALPLFLTGWLVMLFATLVPTMIPLLGAFRQVVAQRPDELAPGAVELHPR